MNLITRAWQAMFPKPFQPIPAGIYQYAGVDTQSFPYRMHLRVEEDGTSLLILNASIVLHLNETGTEMAYWFSKSLPTDEVIKRITERYKVSREEAARDVNEFLAKITTLFQTQDLDPVAFLDMERVDRHPGSLSAPLRLDCAITYQTSEGDQALVPLDRAKIELTTEEWFTIIDKAAKAGIPHLIFTGGEATLRNDLPQLIDHAEKNGLVTGLLTDGLRLTDHSFRSELLQAGLDHIMMLLLDPNSSQSLESLAVLMNEDISVTVHLTIDELTDTAEIIQKLKDKDVKNVSLSTVKADQLDVLKAAQHELSKLDMNLIWDIPVPFSSFNPVNLELESGEQPEITDDSWMYVEPDGDVTHAQGETRILGNLLRETWDTIWANR